MGGCSMVAYKMADFIDVYQTKPITTPNDAR